VPLGWVDESGQARQAHTRAPLSLASGQPPRDDPTDRRHGRANLFRFCAPPRGWRHVTVTAHRPRVDGAHAMREVVDVHVPGAERMIVVIDHLNTDRAASLDHPVPPADARRIARPRDRRCTPRHGSWLTIAELELRVLSSQGLRQRLPERAARDHAVAAWIAPRNAHHLRVHWRFSPEDARRTMLHLYPLPVCVTSCLTRH